MVEINFSGSWLTEVTNILNRQMGTTLHKYLELPINDNLQRLYFQTLLLTNSKPTYLNGIVTTRLWKVILFP